MGLKDYRQKRNFQKTTEPKGGKSSLKPNNWNLSYKNIMPPIYIMTSV